MSTERKVAIITGTLFIVATAASLIGSSLSGPILGAPDSLSQIYANGTRVTLGALLTFLAAAASASIAISLYPVLKKYGEGLALGAVAFRLIEGVFYIVDAICLVALIPLSQQLVGSGSPDAASLQTISQSLLTLRDLAGFVFAVIAFCLGASLYYYVFFQSRLIPRWLSISGFIALTLLLAAVFITLFDGAPFAIAGNLTLLAAPIALQEMVLAVWLIVKGFNPSARVARV